ncbi:MAG: type II toxin-antitoxin system HicA family toxin [Thermodesulfobacteriota bacterium]
MSKFPCYSSKELIKLLEQGGAVFVRQGSTDHAIYSRIVEGKRYSAPVQTGKKTLDPIYCKRLFKQLKFSDQEIESLITHKTPPLLVSEPNEPFLPDVKVP